MDTHIDLSAATGQWYACRTKARAEKQVDRLLRRAGFETYLPIVRRERQWADRKKRVGFPLFPGYTFVRSPLHEVMRVVYTPGVVTLVGGVSRPAVVRPEELEAVERFARGIEETGVEPRPVDWMLPGVEVVVTDGPFKGMRGTLVEVRGRMRVAVKIAALKIASAVQVDAALVRKVA